MIKSGSEDRFYELELYVSGDSFVSERAIASVQDLCEKVLKDRYRLEIIDLQEEPMKAMSENIVAIPTLFRRSPKPERQIIGDLQNEQRVLMGLGIRVRRPQ
ncbi:MAG: circadian clock KaiB family protein [Bacillota bacterium]